MWTKAYCASIQIKAVPAFESVDEILKYDYSNETSSVVLSCRTVYFAVQGSLTF